MEAKSVFCVGLVYVRGIRTVYLQPMGDGCHQLASVKHTHYFHYMYTVKPLVFGHLSSSTILRVESHICSSRFIYRATPEVMSDDYRYLPLCSYLHYFSSMTPLQQQIL